MIAAKTPQDPRPAPVLDLATIRAQLNGLRGQDYWRSLEEIAQTKQFKEMLEREFPTGASEWWDELGRRSFLKLVAATLALGGMTACTKQPTREIFPYVKQPEQLVLGEPLYYATSMVLSGFATGVLAKSREGHPIKVDGSPEHPASLGASSVWLQTSILDLYDPDRSQTVTRAGDISTWESFLEDLNELLKEQATTKGAGLRFLTETVTSPTLASQLNDLQKRFPAAKWCQFDPITRDNIRLGAQLAFGEFIETHYHFDKAAVILSFDADFLYTHPQRLPYTRNFIDGRRVSGGQPEMNRFYVVESTPTVTGTMADHRLPLDSGAIEPLAQLLASELGVALKAPKTATSAASGQWVRAVADDLRRHRGASVVIAGEWQPPSVHALAHLLNDTLGNVGKTVFYAETAEAQPMNQLESLRNLVQEMKAGIVDTLFILGANPVYTAPADLEFNQCLAKVRRSIHLGLELNETAAHSTWHIPQAHYLESWGDARSFDGTISLLQPLIAPLYNGKTAYELLGVFFQQQPTRSDYEIVRDFWQRQNRWPDFDKRWRKALHDGLIPDTQAPERRVTIRPGFAEELNQHPAPKSAVVIRTVLAPNPRAHPALFDAENKKRVRIDNLELCFRPDPNLWDGRFANNGWLQECPKPVNKLTWDNAVLISPALAQRAGLINEDVVEVTYQGRTVRGPIWVMPGQAESSITLHLGYGRRRVGRVGEGVGFNAYLLRPAASPWGGTGASLVATGETHLLVTTQTHHSLHSPARQIYRAATLEQLRADPEVIQKSVRAPEDAQTLYNTDEYAYKGYKWGMSIDLTACIGCNACLVACEVENNIPVVGKEQVNKHREMHWIRVDTYYRGTLDNPRFNHAPIPCMHCEHAPCELVCPVQAAVHDHEGLNLQIYNRCVGTRFCSNNCPYKVRRFNFLRYTDYHTPNFKPLYNPEVTVRWRGVMEKCTYCVQRISAARITAEKENRKIRDGEIRTACQQACPAEAIVFGDLNTPESKVARLKSQNLDYAMLGELNVRPRTTYLARIDNPNPQLKLQPPAAEPQVG
jgi:molybdopterin-containing oxidoreductase family iron-sulfur binding subunit